MLNSKVPKFTDMLGLSFPLSRQHVFINVWRVFYHWYLSQFHKMYLFLLSVSMATFWYCKDHHVLQVQKDHLKTQLTYLLCLELSTTNLHYLLVKSKEKKIDQVKSTRHTNKTSVLNWPLNFWFNLGWWCHCCPPFCKAIRDSFSTCYQPHTLHGLLISIPDLGGNAHISLHTKIFIILSRKRVSKKWPALWTNRWIEQANEIMFKCS